MAKNGKIALGEIAITSSLEDRLSHKAMSGCYFHQRWRNSAKVDVPGCMMMAVSQSVLSFNIETFLESFTFLLL